MSVFSRLVSTLSAKANELIDRFDDPREALDFAVDREREQLLAVRQAIADVGQVEQHIDLQRRQLGRAVTALDALACKAITLDDDDLAREAIARRLVIEDGSASLNAQDAQLALEHDGFIDAARALEHKVQILSVEKEAVKAKYTATGSRTEIDGIVSALQSEVVNVELAVRRAGERVAQLRARARMLDDLLASGVLPDLSRPPGVLGAEVHRVLGSERVTAELATMKKTRGV